MLHCNMQGATTVEWMFCTPATNVARLTRESMQHNATFPNAKAPLLGRTKLQFVESANKPFRPKGGLSQHERLIHPVERNEKREKAATSRPSRKPIKGCGKMWRKEEQDTMIRLEKSLEGHPHIAMQMMEHLPEKSLKQIRDKRREPTFKALVEQYKATQGESATLELQDMLPEFR